MKKAKLMFQIELDYQTKIFQPLSELGTRIYDKDKKKYIWGFPFDKIYNVLALLGHPLKFNDSDKVIAARMFKERKKNIVQGKKQGIGFIEVKLHDSKPNYFVVTTVREQKIQNTNVSFDTVGSLWQVIRRQPIDKKILTATVAENYCKQLGIVGFNIGKNGAFSWKYFSGDRKCYLIFYAAIKVLASYHVVEHVIKASKSGIKRLKSQWSIQTELN